MAAPLIAGNDLRNMSQSTREILTAPEVIAVDQDPLGKQGRRIHHYDYHEVWAKELMHGDRAVALFNRRLQPAEITLLFSDLGPEFGKKAAIRDLWARENLGFFTDSFTAEVPGHGVVLIKARPVLQFVDCSKDGKVDFEDLAILAGQWLETDCNDCNGGDFTGDAQVDAADVAVLAECWLAYRGILAHWRLDETQGAIAGDDVGTYDGTAYGDALWRPAAGKIGGALELDGTDDYVAAACVLNPAQGEFSVFAWAKGGAPGQVILSQTDGTGVGRNWLAAEPSTGNFMTQLKPPGRLGRFLISETPITDGEWHHVGLVWDGSYRYLYVDEAEVAKDSTSYAALETCDGDLYFGADKTLAAGSFWSGLIDDIQVYGVALSP